MIGRWLRLLLVISLWAGLAAAACAIGQRERGAVLAYSSGQPERDGASTELLDTARHLRYRLPLVDVPHALVDWLDARHILLYQPASSTQYLVFTFGVGIQPLTLPTECRTGTLRGFGDQLSCSGREGGGLLIFSRRCALGGCDLAPRRYASSALISHHVWSPDGTRIALSDIAPRTAGLTILTLPSGDLQRVVNSPLSGLGSPIAWSPDSAQIAYYRNQSNRFFAFVYDIAREQESDPIGLGSVVGSAPASWSPDGARLALTYVDNFGADIFTYDLRDGAVVWLTDNKRTSLYPLWSPDGSEIAFVSNRSAGSGLYLMDVEGGDLRQVLRRSFIDFIYRWRP